MKDVGIFYSRLVYYFWRFITFCGDLVYLMVIWYIFPILVCCTKKHLATLVSHWDGLRVRTRVGGFHIKIRACVTRRFLKKALNFVKKFAQMEPF
jgi:hypothetical protein